MERRRAGLLVSHAIRLLILGAAGLTATCAMAEPVGFEHYQVIIDRSPFGGLPGAPGAPPQPNFAESYVFVGIVEEAGKLLAIIQPKGGARAEYKAEGETLGDVTIAKIEPAADQSKLTLQRGLEKATLTYPSRSAVANPPPPVQAQPAPASTKQATAVVPVRRRIPFRRGD